MPLVIETLTGNPLKYKMDNSIHIDTICMELSILYPYVWDNPLE